MFMFNSDVLFFLPHIKINIRTYQDKDTLLLACEQYVAVREPWSF